MDPQGLRIEATGLLHPRPEPADGPELRQRHELVRVGHEEHCDPVAGAGEVVPGGLQGPEIGERRGEHRPEFRRLSGPGLVIGASVRQEGAAGEARRLKVGDGGGQARGHVLPDGPQGAAGGEHPHGIDPEVDIARGEILPPGGGHLAQPPGGLQAPGAGIEAQVDERQHHPREGRLQVGGALDAQPVAPGAGAPAKASTRASAPPSRSVRACRAAAA